MIKIRIPDNNLAEREYILKTLLSDFLGLDIHITADSTIIDYTIEFSEGSLTVQDSFFNKYPESLTYLTRDAVQDKISFVKNEFCFLDDLPVIYGGSRVIADRAKARCEIDIFASAYFMLNRWE